MEKCLTWNVFCGEGTFSCSYIFKKNLSNQNSSGNNQQRDFCIGTIPRKGLRVVWECLEIGARAIRWIHLLRRLWVAFLLTNRFQEALCFSVLISVLQISQIIPGLPWWPTSSWRLTAPQSRCFQPPPGWVVPRTRTLPGPGSCPCGTSPSRLTSLTPSGRDCSSMAGGQGGFYPKERTMIV